MEKVPSHIDTRNINGGFLFIRRDGDGTFLILPVTLHSKLEQNGESIDATEAGITGNR